MKKVVCFLIAILMFVQITAVGVYASTTDEQGSRKIIVFNKDFSDKNDKEKLLKKYGVQKIKHIDIINSTVVNVSPRIEALLKKENAVIRIDEDAEVIALGKPVQTPIPAPTPPPSTQVLPWGISQIEAEKVTIDDVDDPNVPHIKVGVIDTGINLSHPDLQGIVKGGINTIVTAASNNYNDDNGHGTHVAGIIAALDNNNIGVIGVSGRIDLYSIKVLNKKGSGYISDIIEGLAWAVDNGIQVVNMSLGSSAYVKAFQDAVTIAYGKGLVMVAAAGNDYFGPVNYPAKFTEVIAVSATGKDDKIASFSCIGSEVDIAAPGVNIYSTYKGSTYATLSGTSMASPHVTGVAALIFMANRTDDTSKLKADTDEDGIISPAEVLSRIQLTAKILPDETDYAKKYGTGLVNAYNAVNN